jgi:urease subunit alpha
MFGAYGRSVYGNSITFVSQAALDNKVHERLKLQKRIEAVKGCREISKDQMVHNHSMPNIEVNPETYEVKVDGQVVTCEPAIRLPMAQRYYMF